MCDIWPLLVFISLERKDDPCKTGGESRFSILPLLKIWVTLHPLVFISLERKTDPCKTGEKAGLQFYPYELVIYVFGVFICIIGGTQGHPPWNKWNTSLLGWSKLVLRNTFTRGHHPKLSTKTLEAQRTNSFFTVQMKKVTLLKNEKIWWNVQNWELRPLCGDNAH